MEAWFVHSFSFPPPYSLLAAAAASRSFCSWLGSVRRMTQHVLPPSRPPPPASLPPHRQARYEGIEANLADGGEFREVVHTVYATMDNAKAVGADVEAVGDSVETFLATQAAAAAASSEALDVVKVGIEADAATLETAGELIEANKGPSEIPFGTILDAQSTTIQTGTDEFFSSKWTTAWPSKVGRTFPKVTVGGRHFFAWNAQSLFLGGGEGLAKVRLSYVLDSVNRGELAQAMDVLSQRILALQLAKRKGGSWEKAESVDLIPSSSGLASSPMLAIGT